MRPEVHAEMAAVQQRHWWFAARRRIIAPVISRLALPAQAQILEVGCGSGGNLAMLAGFGQLQGIELDDQARSLAASLRICPVRPGSLPDDIHCANASFDLVCLLDVLEHVADDASALSRVARLLRPGGCALITVPAYSWLWSAHDVAHNHHRRYTAGQLRRRAEAAGLQVQRLGYFNALLFPAIALARGLAKLLGRESGSDAALPPAPVNGLLEAVFALERFIVPHWLFPTGTSVMAVLRHNR